MNQHEAQERKPDQEAERLRKQKDEIRRQEIQHRIRLATQQLRKLRDGQ